MSAQFSDQAKKKLEEIKARYPKKDAALLPVLWLAQKEFGWLSPEVRQLVARELDQPLARVESVVSFYTLYNTKPMGKYHLQLCQNISCSLRGCDELVSVVEQELGIKPGETTHDGMFSYSKVECLAACGGAPAMQVNFDYHENVTPTGLRELIAQLKGSRGKDR